MKKVTLVGTEQGWWFVCFAGRLWLPQGDVPHGTASDWLLSGKIATPIGEWQGETVWLIAEKCPQIWHRLVWSLHKMKGCFV